MFILTPFMIGTLPLSFPVRKDHVQLYQCARVIMCTSSKRRLCSFCSSIRFCRSCSSWRLCSSGSLRWAASCACCLFKASERSLFSCCSRRKSLRNVDSPGTFKIELQTEINRIQEELADINIVHSRGRTVKTKFCGFEEGLCSTFISFSGTSVSCTHVH